MTTWQEFKARFYRPYTVKDLLSKEENQRELLTNGSVTVDGWVLSISKDNLEKLKAERFVHGIPESVLKVEKCPNKAS